MISKLLILDSIALLKFWASGFFILHLDGLIHILPLAAIAALLLGILSRKSVIR